MDDKHPVEECFDNRKGTSDGSCGQISFVAADAAVPVRVAPVRDETAHSATSNTSIERTEASSPSSVGGRRRCAADSSRVISVSVAVLLCVLMAGRALVSASFGAGCELSVVRGAGERLQEFTGVSHDLAFLFSAAVAVPVIVFELVAIRAFTHSTAQMLRGFAMAVVPMSVVAIIKLLVVRPRPDTPNGALMADPSFPSGHTACAVVVASLALFALKSCIDSVTARCPQVASSAVFRIVCVVLCAAVVVTPPAVALSRVIYGAHYPTDVIASLVLTPTLVWCMYRLCDPQRR